MADLEQPERDALFNRMVAHGQATFDLALATNGVEGGEPEGERERALVQAGIEAGVLGALEVLRG